ncbi:MAG: DUF2147 domain-containing protein [Sphingomicrobium sp.]
MMKQTLTGFALIGMATAASGGAPIEGQWTNPKRSVVVDVAPCGSAWCGTVVKASDKAKSNARKGGTPNLIGRQILSGLRPIGPGRYKGKAFVPKRNLYASATVRQINPNSMEVEGCALMGLICDEQRWTRVR